MADSQPNLSAASLQSPTPLVYAIRAAGGPHVKIGTTTNIESRLSALQSGCPIPLLIEKTANGGQSLESLLHGFLATYRTQGEWFLCDDIRIESLFTMLRDSSDFVEHLKQLDGLTPANRNRLESLFAEADKTLFDVAIELRLPEFIEKLQSSISDRAPRTGGDSHPVQIRWTTGQIEFIEEAMGEGCFSDFVRLAALQAASQILNRNAPEVRKRGRPVNTR